MLHMDESENLWPKGVDVYGFDDIAKFCRRDLVLLGSDELNLLRHHWIRYLAEPDGTTPAHPNEFLKFLWCSVEATGIDSYDLGILISNRTRFHLATVRLPRSKFTVFIDIWNYNKCPYLVVTQDWFDEILRTHFSLYGLVDAVGMRKLLAAQGHITREQVVATREGIDQLARRHPNHAFLSFADTVLVKTNWSMMGDAQYEATYRPERFLELIEDVRRVFRSALHLDSYAVVTQGANAAAEDGLVSISPERNHVSFGSLGTPFAQLFEMDTAIRKAVRAGLHRRKTLYLANWFFLTLHYKDPFTKNTLAKGLVPFESKFSTPDECSYLPVESEELFDLIGRR